MSDTTPYSTKRDEVFDTVTANIGRFNDLYFKNLFYNVPGFPTTPGLGLYLGFDPATGTFIPKYVPVFNVRNYGAVGDGVTDDVTAILDAVQAASDNGGGIVYVPAGVYLVQDTINVQVDNVILQGENYSESDTPERGSVIEGGDGVATKHIISFGSLDLSPSRPRIRNVGVQYLFVKYTANYTVYKTAGANINFDWCLDTIVDHVYCNNFYNGIQLLGCQRAWIDSVWFGADGSRGHTTDAPSNSCITTGFASQDAGEHCVAVRVVNVDAHRIYNNGAKTVPWCNFGYQDQNVDGWYMMNCHINFADVALDLLNTDNPSGDGVGLVMVSNCFFDQTADETGALYGRHVWAHGSVTQQWFGVTLTGCTFRISNNQGNKGSIVLESVPVALDVTGGLFQRLKGPAIWAVGARSINLTGSTALGTNENGTDFIINATTTDRLHVVSNVFDRFRGTITTGHVLGILGTTILEATICNNTFVDAESGAADAVIRLLGATKATINGNTIQPRTTVSVARNIYLDTAPGQVTIVGNTVADCTQESIYVNGATQTQISGNNISNAAVYGIRVQSCNNSNSSNNNIIGCATGMFIQTLNHNISSNNNLSTFTADGILISTVTFSSVVGNNLQTATGAANGIRTAGSTTDTLVITNNNLADVVTVAQRIVLAVDGREITIANNPGADPFIFSKAIAGNQITAVTQTMRVISITGGASPLNKITRAATYTPAIGEQLMIMNNIGGALVLTHEASANDDTFSFNTGANITLAAGQSQLLTNNTITGFRRWSNI